MAWHRSCIRWGVFEYLYTIVSRVEKCGGNISVISGGHGKLAVEYTGKIADIRVSCFFRDLRYLQIRAPQEVFCFLHPSLRQDLGKILVRVLLDKPAQVGGVPVYMVG